MYRHNLCDYVQLKCTIIVKVVISLLEVIAASVIVHCCFSLRVREGKEGDQGPKDQRAKDQGPKNPRNQRPGSEDPRTKNQGPKDQKTKDPRTGDPTI